MDTIDISKECKALVKALPGVAYDRVVSVLIDGGHLEAITYKLNENKASYIDPQTNEMAIETHTFSIKT